MALVCVAAFKLLLDITIVNVALLDIQSDLGAGLASLQWVVDANALTLASFLLVAGSIGDRVGRRATDPQPLDWPGVFTFSTGLWAAASAAYSPASLPTTERV